MFRYLLSLIIAGVLVVLSATAVPDCALAQSCAPCTLEQYVPPDPPVDAQSLEKRTRTDSRVAAQAGDTKLMLTIICQAAAAGLPLAETMLGALSAEGAFGVSKDETQARYWLKRASQKGDAKAMLGLHELYWAGRGGPQMKREAIVLLKIAAQAELPDAQYLLGLLYIMGVDEELPQDIRAAYEWLKRAEAAGHPKAADVMSQMRLQYPELK